MQAPIYMNFLLTLLLQTVASTSIHHEKEKYLVELVDQLEVLIALRQFEKGVVYLENGKFELQARCIQIELISFFQLVTL